MTELTVTGSRGIIMGALHTLAIMAVSDPDEFKAALKLADELGNEDGGLFELVSGRFAATLLERIDKEGFRG